MSRETLAQAWAIYRRQVIAASAPAMQIKETRRAFYGGAQALLEQIANGLDPGSEVTQDDVDYLSQIHQELLVFADDVMQGRA
jgi:hypothetical protein